MTSSSRIGGLEWSEKLLSSWMNVMSDEGWKQNTNDQLVSSNLLLSQNGSLIMSKWTSWLVFPTPSMEMMLSSLSSTSFLKWLTSFQSKNPSQQLSWQSYTPPELSPCTAFHNWFLQIVEASSPLSSRTPSRRPWAQTFASAQLSILKLVAKSSESIKFLKICSGLVSFPLAWNGKIVFHMPSSPTTTVSKRVWARPHSRFFMAESAVLLSIGQRLVNANFLAMT